MKRLVRSIPLIITMAMTSLVASGTETIGKPKVTVVQHLTATQNGRVRVSVHRINKPKIFVGNPHKITIFADDWDDNFLDVDDTITSYRRRDLNKIEHVDGLPEHIRWRLFLARQLALIKFRQIQESKIA